MKMCFDRYGEDWYLIPADMRCAFIEDGYVVACAEDEFMEDEDSSAAVAWSDARREFREKYGQYRLGCHISSVTFENHLIEGFTDCSGEEVKDGDEVCL